MPHGRARFKRTYRRGRFERDISRVRFKRTYRRGRFECEFSRVRFKRQFRRGRFKRDFVRVRFKRHFIGGMFRNEGCWAPAANCSSFQARSKAISKSLRNHGPPHAFYEKVGGGAQSNAFGCFGLLKANFSL